MRSDAVRATAAQSAQHCRDTRPSQDMCEKVFLFLVDWLCFWFVSAPRSAAAESKISSSGVVVFLATLCPHQTHVVNRIFELLL